MKTVIKSIIILLLIGVGSDLSAQSAEIKQMLGSNDYLVGRGEDRDFERADRQALADLISQISVSVQASFTNVTREDNLALSEFSERMVTTFSTSILNGAERKIEPLSNAFYRVYRYIRKEDRSRLFQQRESKIREYFSNGRRAQDVNDFDFALRSYYWALVLLQSHPERNNIFVDVDKERKLLSVIIPDIIQALLREVKLIAENIVKGSDNNALYISAQNSRGKIRNLNLKYFDSEAFIAASIKDGKGALYLPTEYVENISSVNASIDYQFQDLLGNIPLDEEVKMVMEYVFIPFDNAKQVILKATPEKSLKPAIQKPVSKEKHLVKMTQDIVNAIKTRDFASAREHFSHQGYEQFIKIMNYGNVSLFEGQHSIDYVEVGKQTLIRTIPLVIQLTDRSRKVIYDNISPIVEDGKVVWVNFAINDQDLQDAIKRGKVSGDLQERLLCLTFMEYYKTVFALKDL